MARIARAVRIAPKKASFGTSMGVSSIIAILVILVLVVFSALSIATSKADLTLSQKSSSGIKAFYEADSAAEEMMADISAAVSESDGWRALLTENGCSVSEVSGGSIIGYTVPIDENRKLDVELFLDTAGKLTRTLWQVVPAKEWVPDESLNLYIP